MPIVTFGKEVEPSGIVGFEKEVTTSNKKPTFEIKDDKVLRPFLKGTILDPRARAVAHKAAFGDIPFLRNLLPKATREIQPKGKIEKITFVGGRIARDLAVFRGTRTAVGVASKLPFLSKLATGGKLAKQVKEGIAIGSIFGATTAGTEDPKEIIKEAAKTGAFLGAIPFVFRGVAATGSRLAKTSGGKKLLALQNELAGKFMKKIRPVISRGTAKARVLIRRRHSEIGLGQFESELFARNLEQNLSKAEREAIPFLREGTQVPKMLNRPDLEAIVNTQKERLAPAVKEISNYLDDAHKFLLENHGKDIGFVENFIPRLWDIPKAKRSQVINWFVTKNPHLKQRSIRTIKEGVEKFGLTPKTLDVAELVRIYDQFKIKTVANNKFVRGLLRLKGRDLKPLIQPVNKAPVDWKPVDHWALRKVMFSGKKLTDKGAEQIFLSKTPVKVAPEIAREVKTVLDTPFSSGGTRALETVNAFAKKANLSFSLFHHTALTETGIATGISKDIAKMWNPTRILKALKNRDYDIYRRIGLTKDAIKHGVQFGAIPDVQLGRVRAALDSAVLGTKNIPLLAGATKHLRNFNNIWDRALWDYYHNGLKLYGYEKLLQDALKLRPNIAPNVVKREVAQMVNDTFGGQSWDLLLTSPKFLQQMQWLMLAPDWTLSTLRQAASPLGMGAVSNVTRGLRAELGQRFWERGALYMWGGLNLLNRAFTAVETGKGRWMWENSIGNETRLFVGFNENGTEKYVRWGKQFRELPEFFIDPVKKFGAKLSPSIRAFIEQFTGVSVGGFPQKFKGKPFLEGIPERAKSLTRLAIPFSFSGFGRSSDPLSFALPVSQGATNFRIREAFKVALKSRNINRIRKIYISALNNNLDAERLFKQSRAEVKSDITFDFRKEAFKFIKRIRRLGKEKGEEEIRRLENQGKLTPQLKKQIMRILKEKGRVGKQKEKLGIKGGF